MNASRMRSAASSFVAWGFAHAGSATSMAVSSESTSSASPRSTPTIDTVVVAASTVSITAPKAASAAILTPGVRDVSTKLKPHNCATRAAPSSSIRYRPGLSPF
eukprot:scaffold103053_cov96-Phaeocystis_antarctica.AAC.2